MKKPFTVIAIFADRRAAVVAIHPGLAGHSEWSERSPVG